ncbi:MAG: SPOR domain-containing protein [Betaproteobacteria bacterium]|nr:SPOR domain-containing protein [Betaproteobacteria bacterium]
MDVEKLIPGVNWPATPATQAARAPQAPGAAAGAAAGGTISTTPLPPPPPLAEAVLPEPPAVVVAPAGTAGRAATAPAAAPSTAADLPAKTGALPLAAESGGVFLQLGAFADRNNAETFLGRIRPELGDAAKLAHVYQSRGLHRVHLGPYAGEREARVAVDTLMRRLSIKPVLAVR